MKILHCADIHLGSRMESRLPHDKALERRAELRRTFERMLDLAEREGAAAVIIAGDIFDSDRPFKKDKETFYHAVASHPEMEFLCLRGNHDTGGSYTEELPNLRFFSEEWTTFTFPGAAVSGIELTPGNALSLYSEIPRVEEPVHIAVMHGQISDSAGAGLIQPRRFRGAGVDYLALGHVHSYSVGYFDPALPGEGKYCYSGCPEGRGFDEPGEHGCVLIDTDVRGADGISARFLPLDGRVIREYTVDLSGADDAFAARELAEAATEGCPPGDLIRLLLTGELSFDADRLADDIALALSDRCYFASVRDHTLPRTAPAGDAEELSLCGEFLRAVRDDETLTDEEKRAVSALGRRVLADPAAEL